MSGIFDSVWSGLAKADYTSAEVPLLRTSGKMYFNHGLEVVPRFYMCVLRFTGNQNGYVTGQEVQLFSANGAYGNRAIGMVANATTVFVKMGNSAPFLMGQGIYATDRDFRNSTNIQMRIEAWK